MYTVDYFINKFSKIPEDNWSVGEFRNGNKCCANGHCGTFSSGDSTDESVGLREVFKGLSITLAPGEVFWTPNFQNGISVIAANINDGKAAEYQQPTPKQRILAALYDIKKMQSPEPEVKEKIVYVSVPVTITEQAKELVLS